ncbi:MAG TPA: Maf family nucleotide pyrophosphatase [Stellaceae bacterium]|jgi:septum formation protein|nr:Maf family nucleotide pyrophosphatase [Stellaceae bacterium]
MIILASSSRTRAALLDHAGIKATRDPPRIDETEIKAFNRRKGAEAGIAAMALAEAKALTVAARHPKALVIGADQLLNCNGAWLDKPTSRADARNQLALLRGQSHELVTAVCVARDADVIWHDLQRPRLAMRDFADEFLADYVAALSREDLGAVGAYRIEGRGIQLFERIEGDYFAILGLPLLPLLDFLRGQGELAP